MSSVPVSGFLFYNLRDLIISFQDLEECNSKELRDQASYAI